MKAIGSGEGSPTVGWDEAGMREGDTRDRVLRFRRCFVFAIAVLSGGIQLGFGPIRTYRIVLSSSQQAFGKLGLSGK